MITLLDLDNTMFKTDEYKADLLQGLAKTHGQLSPEEINGLYKQIKQEKGYLDWPAFRELMANNGLPITDFQRVEHTLHFDQYLYPKAASLLANLLKLNRKLIFYSEGDFEIQQRKLLESGLMAILGKDYLAFSYEQLQEKQDWLIDPKPLLLIDSEKRNRLLDFIRSIHEQQPSEQIWFVDDRPDFMDQTLQLVKNEKIPFQPIWIEQGSYANGKVLKDNQGVLSFKTIAEFNNSLSHYLKETTQPLPPENKQ